MNAIQKLSKKVDKMMDKMASIKCVTMASSLFPLSTASNRMNASSNGGEDLSKNIQLEVSKFFPYPSYFPPQTTALTEDDSSDYPDMKFFLEESYSSKASGTGISGPDNKY